jgi:hypothetical protein
MRQVGAQCLEVVDQPFLVIGDLEGVEEIVFEIEQVAEDRLLAKLLAGDSPVIVQLVVTAYLQTRQLFETLLEEGVDSLIMPLFLQFVQQRDVSEI